MLTFNIGNMMSTKEYILIYGTIFVAACFLVAFLRSQLQRIRVQKRHRNIIRQMLQAAQEQNEIFDLKMLDSEDDKKGFAAILLEQKPASLSMEVLSYVSGEWTGARVVVHFRDPRPEEPVYYKFSSTIQAVQSGREKSFLTLAAPTDLEVGQKRKFIRIKPHKDAVWSISAWPVDPAKPLPRSTVEAGPAVISYKLGMEDAPVQVENISGTGMALRFQKECAEAWPVDLVKGSQILCAIEYLMDTKSEQPGTYWCVCRIVNSREVETPVPALILGVEFTNWALPEKDQPRLHWFRCSSTMGVTQITQWVMRMNLEQRKRITVLPTRGVQVTAP